jgi:hypothetical protein
MTVVQFAVDGVIVDEDRIGGMVGEVAAGSVK